MQVVRRKSGLEVWIYRWFEPGPTGRPQRIKRVVGPLSQFSTEKKAWAEIERLGLGRSFDEYGPRNLKELADHFTKTELAKEQVDDGLSFSTKECYRLYLKNWIIPRWGLASLWDIKAVAVEEWLGQLDRVIGKGENQFKQPLAPGSKKKIRDVLHVLFEHAKRYEWTDRNPISSVRQGAKRLAIPELIDIKDLGKLIFEVLELRERVMVFLDFGGGFRRGELAGLKWEDIDFEKGEVQAKRSIVRQVIGKTKTEASKKPMPLDPYLLSDLKLWRRETMYAADEDYVFASEKMKGKQPLWLDTVIKRRIKPKALKAGIRLKGWHVLRHTYSTLLKANGNDPKVVQELLRHANLRTTMDGYTQALSPDKRRAHRGVIRLLLPRQVPRQVPRQFAVGAK
jgi:integrase